MQSQQVFANLAKSTPELFVQSQFDLSALPSPEHEDICWCSVIIQYIFYKSIWSILTIVQVLFLQQSPTPCKLKAHIIILYLAQKVEYQMKNIITRVSWVKDVNDLILPSTCSITFASLVNFIRSSSGITLQPELGLFAFWYLSSKNYFTSFTLQPELCLFDSSQSGAVEGIIWGPFLESLTHLGAPRRGYFRPSEVRFRGILG